ncbi:MAG TPA: hypothetical protein VN132_13580, partial [Bdellovibrio sp.]|nr:hypothetical protein [Bdellovibrio sp.]
MPFEKAALRDYIGERCLPFEKITHQDSIRVFFSSGASQATTPTTKSVIVPPKITEGTRPKRRAATPDSKAPISFDEVMNMEFKAEIRPRILSGVSSCK